MGATLDGVDFQPRTRASSSLRFFVQHALDVILNGRGSDVQLLRDLVEMRDGNRREGVRALGPRVVRYETALPRP